MPKANDLIIQAPATQLSSLEVWRDLSRAEKIEEITRYPFIYRFIAPKTPQEAIPLMASAGFDVALVPRDRTLDKVALVAMDMDSTLITIECVDEIADSIGIKDKIAAITERSMRGEIDFRASLTERVALLKGTPATALEEVYNTRLKLSPGAETMLSHFHNAGAKTLLVSGGFTFFTDRLKARLNLTHAVSNELEIKEGKLTGKIVGDIVDATRKSDEIKAMQARCLTEDKTLTIAVGDGANDLPMLALADVSFAYHAKPILRAEATHAIDHCGLDAMVWCFNGVKK